MDIVVVAVICLFPNNAEILFCASAIFHMCFVKKLLYINKECFKTQKHANFGSNANT